LKTTRYGKREKVASDIVERTYLIRVVYYGSGVVDKQLIGILQTIVCPVRERADSVNLKTGSLWLGIIGEAHKN